MSATPAGITTYQQTIMKLIITTALCLFLATSASLAQHANIGIKGGINAYTLNSENSNNDRKIGYHIGLMGHFHISDNFALQPELVYSVQGAKYSIAGTEAKLNLNYINVPLLFQYMFDNSFRLQAGPQLGLLVSAKNEIGNTKTDVKSDFEKIDLGLSVGVSYVNPASNLGVDLRYNPGFTNINKTSTNNAFNNGFQAGIFYLFNHKS